MKALLPVLLALTISLHIAGTASAVPTRQEYAGRDRLEVRTLAGSEHSPLIYSGSDTISSSANFGAYTTNWMQIGFSPNVSDTGNRRAVEHNPQVFTLRILKKHAFAVAADSCWLTSARFETADSATATIPYWNADSSNLFIASTNYSRADYGVWTFLTDSITTFGYEYTLRVLEGSHIRFVFATTAEDCTIVEWKLKAEH